MGELKVTISDEVYKRFREEVYKRKGAEKGNITEAVEEALEMWIMDAILLDHLNELKTRIEKKAKALVRLDTLK